MPRGNFEKEKQIPTLNQRSNNFNHFVQIMPIRTKARKAQSLWITTILL